jgi:hypothetical protein
MRTEWDGNRISGKGSGKSGSNVISVHDWDVMSIYTSEIFGILLHCNSAYTILDFAYHSGIITVFIHIMLAVVPPIVSIFFERVGTGSTICNIK